MRMWSSPAVMLFLLSSLLTLEIGATTPSSSTTGIPQNHFWFSSSVRSDIMESTLSPLFSYIEKELGLDVHISMHECDVVKRYATTESALIYPLYPVYGPLLRRGYVPIVQSAEDMEVLFFSRKPIYSLSDLAGKSMAARTRFIELLKSLLNQQQSGLGDQIDMLGTHMADSVFVKVLSGEAETGAITSLVWKMIAPEVREKLYTVQLQTTLPQAVILAHPKLDQKLFNSYQQALTNVSSSSATRDFVNKFDLGGFSVARSSTDMLSSMYTGSIQDICDAAKKALEAN